MRFIFIGFLTWPNIPKTPFKKIRQFYIYFYPDRKSITASNCSSSKNYIEPATGSERLCSLHVPISVRDVFIPVMSMASGMASGQCTLPYIPAYSATPCIIRVRIWGLRWPEKRLPLCIIRPQILDFGSVPVGSVPGHLNVRHGYYHIL